MSGYANIRYSVAGGVGVITLARPAKRNALSHDLVRELRRALEAAEDDHAVKVLVLEGDGPHFSSGGDMSGEAPTSPREHELRFRAVTATFKMLMDIEKPVIAKVQGACLGAAFELAMACDVVICSDDAYFAATEVRFSGGFAFLTLPWLVGMRATRSILLTGADIPAPRALEWQLINSAVPRESLDDEVGRWCQRLSRIPPANARRVKAQLSRAYEIMGLNQALTMFSDYSTLAVADPVPESEEFERRLSEHGVKKAIEWRDAGFESL